MLTTGATLTIFLMLGISSIAVFWAKRLKIPHTVLLVIVGVVLGMGSTLTPLSFLREFELTPELLFYLLLPTLIFESAYQMDVRKLVYDARIVLLLSVGSFLLSTFAIAGLLYVALGAIGFSVPFVLLLLFGSLISATDPVAVLALFKEYGVPRRLSLIFEGESLFNDATAVAFFLIILEALRMNNVETLTNPAGLISFVSMLVGGALFGLIIGSGFAWLVGVTRASEAASITLTIVLAHVTFIMAEILSHHMSDVTPFALSPIIATTVASLLMGNYGRARLNAEVETFVTRIWEQFAFMANSLIFLLMGVLIAKAAPLIPALWPAILVTIVVVAIGRAVSIYPVTTFFNKVSTPAQRLPRTWEHLLAWGSLRGALAITMVLLIPDNLTIPAWSLPHSPKDFLLVLTISCITATLLIKATTIRSLVERWKLNALTTVEQFEYQEARALMHQKVTERLQYYIDRGYIDPTIATTLIHEHQQGFTTACETIKHLSSERQNDLAIRILRMYAIGIERRYLTSLYHNDEVTETVYRKISGKLKLQLEAIQNGNLSPDTTIHVDARDIFEQLLSGIASLVTPKDDMAVFAERYQYYRAQAIISRKVLKELDATERASTIFTAEALKHVTELYRTFKENAERKLHCTAETHPTYALMLAETLALKSVRTIERAVLDDITQKELVTPALQAVLEAEISHPRRPTRK